MASAPRCSTSASPKLAGDHAGVKTQATAMMGTPMFMSPEQCRGAGQVDSAGNVYVVDNGNSNSRKVTAGGVVTTLAGTAGMVGSVDGTGAAARFRFPIGVAVDSAGNVYVADYYNSTIRKVTAGGVVTTLAGSAGTIGSTDGTGAAARFNYPTSVAIQGK